MSAIIVALAAVVVFAAVLAVTSIGSVGKRVVSISMAGVSAILDSDLDDDSKERQVRRAGIDLLLVSWGIAWRFSVALGGTAVPILLADALNWVSLDSVISTMLRVDFIVSVTVVLIALGFLLSRLKHGETKGIDDVSGYTVTDQFFHMLAFSSPAIMKAASRLDEFVYRKQVEELDYAPEVFVTSLARGGTTALLNALATEPSLATFQYRDMPFVTAPVLWSHLLPSSRQVARRQRAHGDGLEIDLNSPEAFDEVIWMLGWPRHYLADRIEPWQEDDETPDGRAMLDSAFRRVALLRSQRLLEGRRVTMHYLSKNNANIARIPLLVRMFPQCKIVIALRQPEAHALSLMRQHENFTRLHARGSFVERYMRDIGHFEFGLLHRPIAFPGFRLGLYDPREPDYWLHYWVSAFREVERYREKCVFVTQDSLRSDPNRAIESLMARLDLPSSPTDYSKFFHSKPDKIRPEQFSDELVAEARAIYAHLAISVVG